jgi:serine/threonine protein kinase
MAADRFGFDQTQLEEFLGGIRSKVEEFSAILGVDTAGCPDFDELLAVGCEELVKVSLEAPTGQDGKTAEHTETMDSVVAGSRTLRDFLDEPCSLTSGSRILQYEVTQVIGRGAMGIVLKAYDAGLNRHVAIKLLAPEMAGNEKARQRFALEARFAAALRHEHVVAIYAVNELEGVPFLVMEYVQGSSLEALIDSGRTFSTAEIANIGRQTALGLAVAHEARLIHRDVKPANILLEEGTLNVRVADFGLARAIDEDFHLSQPGLLLGTPLFMSPEQVDGKPLTAASDQFSLGSVLYLLCTGQLPFDADTMSGLLHAVADKNPAPIRTLNPSIPEGVARVVETLHAKDPTKRFSSAAEVAEKLKPWCH